MTPFVYFNHINTLGFWTEKNSHAKEKTGHSIACLMQTVYGSQPLLGQIQLLFTTANNQIPGRSSACDLHHWV